VDREEVPSARSRAARVVTTAHASVVAWYTVSAVFAGCGGRKVKLIATF
jgi:hypothetical protein